MTSVTIIGRIVAEPVTKETANSQLVMFTLVENKIGKDKEKVAHFYDCKIWGKYGEIFTEYTSKGDLVCVKGELNQDRWEADGQKRSKITIIVDKFEFTPKWKKDDKVVEVLSKNLGEEIQEEQKDINWGRVPF